MDKKWTVDLKEGLSANLCTVLDKMGLGYTIDESTQNLCIDFSAENQTFPKDKLDMVLHILGTRFGSNNNSDVYLHGTSKLSKEYSQEECFQTANSYFQNGIKYNYGRVITSTASLMKSDSSVAGKVLDYNFARAKFIINIPEQFQDLYLGAAIRKDFKNGETISYEESTSSLDHSSARYSTVDFLDLDHIPKEFIVGVFYYTDDDLTQGQMIVNPNYLYFKENTQVLENGETVSNLDSLKHTIENAQGYERFLQKTAQMKEVGAKNFFENNYQSKVVAYKKVQEMRDLLEIEELLKI